MSALLGLSPLFQFLPSDVPMSHAANCFADYEATQAVSAERRFSFKYQPWFDYRSPCAANCFADYGAAQAMSAEHTSELRGGDDAAAPSSARSLATAKV